MKASTSLYLSSWYREQTDFYPTEEEIAEERAEYEREEAKRLAEQQDPIDYPDEEYPEWDEEIPF
jgi:hypothetical protein